MRKSKKSTYKELFRTNPNKVRREKLSALYESRNLLIIMKMKKEKVNVLKKEVR